MTPAVERLVLATDGSENAVRAADHALYLAGVFGAELHAVSAVGAPERTLARLADSVRAKSAVEAEEAVATVTRKALATDVPTKTTVVDGPPARVVTEAGSDADLLVVGRHGHTGLGRFLVGSVTERVLDDPPAPTLVVPAEADATPNYETIALLVDDSPVGRTAATTAVAVARATGAKLDPLAVVDDRFTDAPGLRRVLEEEARRLLKDVAVEAARAAVESTATVRTGVPAAELLDYADETRADLVVVGTDASRSLDRHVATGVARRIVRRTTVPVLVVPTKLATEKVSADETRDVEHDTNTSGAEFSEDSSNPEFSTKSDSVRRTEFE
ncbi:MULTISPECIES: universal stress protein [Haloferax]|uniref:Universal stress protein n=1 Tax=Haloferax marinum TaxID=2666143 RepID=A0A6A8GA41_9EURY|nr:MULTISPECIES: universal stress protein [Haloferax]KAB1198824.1 universal stress protein [Haloferax sp. CBA1150]MRW97944.1 universal stress protein [Haloferax marinum]